jgi:hypothetical protein
MRRSKNSMNYTTFFNLSYKKTLLSELKLIVMSSMGFGERKQSKKEYIKQATN